MMVLLLCLVVAGIIFLLCYGGWWWSQNITNGKNKAVAAERLKFYTSKDNIITEIYQAAHKRKKPIPGSETLKIAIIEKLNISPEMMRKCLKELINQKLVIESEDAVSLTTFGVNYYEVFIRYKVKLQ